MIRAAKALNRAWLRSIVCLLLASACWDSSTRSPQSSGNTNWLKLCASDASCGADTSCVCGVCTRACDASDECGGASCADPQASDGKNACAAEQRGERAGICLRRCTAASECGTGQVCAAGSCIASAALPPPDSPLLEADACDATVASCDPSSSLSLVIEQSRRATTPADPNARVWSCEGGALRVDPASYDEAFAVAVAADSLVLGGAATAATGDGSWRIERRSLGDLSPALEFGSRGVIASGKTSGWDSVGALAADGEFLYVAGVDGFDDPSHASVRVEKHELASGALVPAFGAAGEIALSFGATASPVLHEPAMGHGMIIDAEHLYLGGTGFGVEKRRLRDGAGAAAFGAAGVARSTAAASSIATALALRDGVLYAVGPEADADLRLEARDAVTGALRYEIIEQLAVGSCHPAHATVATAADDALYLALATSAGQWRIERRSASDGSLVYAKEVAASGACDGASAIAVADGAMYVAGSFDQRWRVEKRSLADGELIASFGRDGVIDGGVRGAISAIALRDATMYLAGVEGQRDNVQSSVWRVERRSLLDGALMACPAQAPDVPRAPECASRARVVAAPSADCSARVTSSSACAVANVRATTSAGSRQDWTLPEGAAIADDSAASVELGDEPSSVLLLRGFGIAVPDAARVTGISVGVSRESVEAEVIGDYDVRLVQGEHILGANRGGSSAWPVGVTQASYGAASDLWDATWSPEQINAPDFGVALRVRSLRPGATGTAKVRALRIDVHYCE